MGAGRQQDSDHWYLARGGEQFGPYPFSLLIEAIQKKIIGKDDLVWRAGWNSWRPAHSVPGLVTRRELASPRLELPTLNKSDIPAATKRVPQAEGQKRNYFVRHWRGDLSLPVSYWINGFLVSLAAYIVVFGFTVLIESAKLQAGAPIALALTCSLIVVLVLSAWQLVGIWRSASRHSVKGKRFWPGAAKAMVIITILKSFVDLGNTFFPIFAEHIHIAMGDQRFGESRFRLLRNGTELEFAGGINIGTAREFERMLDAATEVRVLHLNSPGGRVAEADLMAAEVRNRRLITYVSERCESACIHVFLAGHERWISERGKLGFHQPSFSGLGQEDLARLVEQERRDLISMGLPTEFVSKALETPSNEMWRPSHEELIAARVISGVSDRSRFAASGYLASLSTSDLEQVLLKNPLYAALKRAEPKTFEGITAQLMAGYRRGDSEEEIILRARSIISKTAMQRLPHAADANILQSADILIGYMAGLKSVDPESCVALEDPSRGARLKSDLQKQFPAIASKELTLLQTLIESESHASRSLPTDQQVDAYLDKVRSKLESRPGLQLAVLDKDQLMPGDYKPYCEAALAFYEEIRRLPTREASAVLRNIYAEAGR
jgi:hypothetical protein